MVVDVRVRRCTLTIRRRDGWSWGPGPQPHIDAALAAIEAAIESALVEARVDERVDDALDVALDEPVRLEFTPDGVATYASWIALVERLRAPRAAPAPVAPAVAPRLGETADVQAASDGDRPGAPGAVALARTLASWSRGGQMERVVGAWPEGTVRAWLDAIEAGTAAAAQSGAAGALAEDVVHAIAAALLGSAAAPRPGSRTEAERQLVVIAALAAALGDRLPDAATQACVRRTVAGSAPAAPGSTSPDRHSTASAAAADAPEPPASRMPRGAVMVPALPLLVLAALARIGYADAMEAAGRAAGLPGAGASLGAAVAGKVLPPPDKGWRREPSEQAVIDLAGGGMAADGAARVSHLLSAPLRSALVAAYAQGRSANDEVLVTATGEGVIAGEEAGLLPIAWVANRDELDAVLRGLGCPPVRRSAAFAPIAEALGPRRALPRADAIALERDLGAAAGTALGLIAADVWGGQGSPLLALERLGDLEARVELTPNGLVAGIPRGRRWLDLRRGGMLSSVQVAWLPGATLEVASW